MKPGFLRRGEVELATLDEEWGNKILELESQMRRTLIGLVSVIAIVSGAVFLRSTVSGQSVRAGQTGGAKLAGERTVGETSRIFRY
jgi:hypothetical protein